MRLPHSNLTDATPVRAVQRCGVMELIDVLQLALLLDPAQSAGIVSVPRISDPNDGRRRCRERFFRRSVEHGAPCKPPECTPVIVADRNAGGIMIRCRSIDATPAAIIKAHQAALSDDCRRHDSMLI